MTAISFPLGSTDRAATTSVWHLHTVIVPRRTITGRLVRGQVWRRHDGRRWLQEIYSVAGGVTNDCADLRGNHAHYRRIWGPLITLLVAGYFIRCSPTSLSRSAHSLSTVACAR